MVMAALECPNCKRGFLRSNGALKHRRAKIPPCCSQSCARLYTALVKRRTANERRVVPGSHEAGMRWLAQKKGEHYLNYIYNKRQGSGTAIALLEAFEAGWMLRQELDP